MSNAEPYRLIVLGAGGHARVVVDAARSAGFEVIGMTDRNEALFGTVTDDVKVLGGDDVIETHADMRTGLALGMGTVASREDAGSAVRQRIFDQWCNRDHFFPVIISAHAHVCGNGIVGEGTQIMAGAVVQPGCEIGKAAIINTRASIDHDCRISDHVHIAPGAVVCGNVSVGQGAFVGAGAVIVQGVKISAGAIIAAGATVRKDVAKGEFVSGRNA